MENRLYSLEEVAQMMGKTPAEINDMRTQGKIYGLRDGGTWKFKGPDVEKLLNPPEEQPYDEDLLLDEGSIISSDEGGTVIGSDKINLESTNSDNEMSQSALDINSTLDNDTPSAGLKDESSVLDIGEDDLVLGESDIMSDVTLNGESSGINLYKPEGDSGISLDGDDLNSAMDGGSVAMDSDSLNVNLDDLVLDDDSLSIIDDGGSMEDDGGDENFTLTTTPDDAEDESETGSQVIALSENSSDEFSDPLMGIGPGAIPGAAPEGMELGIPSDGMSDAGAGNFAGVLPDDVTPELIAAAREIGKKEKPYSILNVLSLFLCLVLLTMTLIMSVDLVRNMWSWNQPYQINSNLMDWLLSYFE